MIDRDKDDNKYHAVCDCCYEMSDGYYSFDDCVKGIREDGWRSHYDKFSESWEHLCPDCA